MGAANTKRVRKPRKGARNEDGEAAGEVKRSGAGRSSSEAFDTSGLSEAQIRAARNLQFEYLDFSQNFDARSARELQSANRRAQIVEVDLVRLVGLSRFEKIRAEVEDYNRKIIRQQREKQAK